MMVVLKRYFTILKADLLRTRPAFLTAFEAVIDIEYLASG